MPGRLVLLYVRLLTLGNVSGTSWRCPTLGASVAQIVRTVRNGCVFLVSTLRRQNAIYLLQELRSSHRLDRLKKILLIASKLYSRSGTASQVFGHANSISGRVLRSLRDAISNIS
ncbi:hypothetical protein R3P38DRAFT_2916076 [Favolaschia claudopus]|uniref:Secreted protein n=1 Tax=Favolaschia claudopus TaxID=2862362 RepID=A0AAW0C594_9AGAR